MDQEETRPEFKVVIMGDSSVGKTSIVQRFNQETFDYSMDTTIGASFLTKIVETDLGQVNLNVWDTAGQERYRSLIPTYARGAHAAIICYDTTIMVTFEAVPSWIEELHKFCTEEVPIYIVGNKSDLKSVVSEEQAHSLADQYHAKYALTSAKTGVGITDLFKIIATDLAKTKVDFKNDTVDLQASKDNSKKKCC
ncbi:small GTP-binding protein, putative [Trichomonas vaginalis G3]|uniref:Small GTP-binding protein, putative n=2 Tax=Trichomonas vaginalis TaxID=5722 RepID=A0A8U0WP59_TRIV3|nr:small Rab GTPase RabX12 [Trichomonas vaginalis G3]AAY83829.1 small Rab GTPase RabX12 [Trichomonas vaginalis]EAY02466.1 small GTP-binding protein, putative [Trichomonas vaginalis G3]KAI5511217.1 small Rab GTPase RabX12 [Trichomonas vaginalis G3]|eukprot:XP_001314705.1 small GTP-binding protein [Trichomonas vaginalis G3]